jgi:hypothetical protein
VKLWAAGKIEDTPHGCFARMMREGRSAESGTSPHCYKLKMFDYVD